MTDQPKSDRTSVTISKRVHRELKIAAARLGVTQRSLLEHLITAWVRCEVIPEYSPEEEED